MNLTQTDRQALGFLTQGPDAPGVIDTEEVFCAHLVFLDLVERGLAEKDIGDDGPIYSITAAGRTALDVPIAQ